MIKRRLFNDVKQIELMAIHKLQACFSCSVVNKQSEYIMMNDGFNYKVIFCNKEFVYIPTNTDPHYFLLVIPKYRDNHLLLCYNFNFYLVHSGKIQELINNKLCKKNLFYCINKMAIFEKEILIQASFSLG